MRIPWLQRPFPFYFEDTRKNGLLALALGLYVFLFLTLFQPAPIISDRQNSFHLLGYGAVAAAVLALNIFGLPRVWPESFGNWTLGKYLLFNIWNVLITALCITLFNWTLLFNWGDLQILWSDQRDTALMAVIPVVLIGLILYQKRLRDENPDANRMSRTAEPPDDASRDENQIEIETDTSEKLQLDPGRIRYAQAKDNYVALFWESESGLSRKLLRLSLSNLETQLPKEYFFRCHRSYLINLRAVEKVTGNANRLIVSLQDTDEQIPVSRSGIPEFQSLLRSRGFEAG